MNHIKHCKGYFNNIPSDFYFFKDKSVLVTNELKDISLSDEEYTDFVYNGWVQLSDKPEEGK